MTTTELFSGLKPITLDCLSVFEPFYQERARHYALPAFKQSVLVLVYTGRVFYKILTGANGKILLIVKNTKIYGRLGVQMPIAPISLSGSVADERAVIQAALRFGVSLRATNEDIIRYRIPRNLCSDASGTYNPDSREYIYNAVNGKAMTGSQYRKQRYQVKRITQSSGFSLMTGVHPDADALVQNWDARYKQVNGERTDQQSLWRLIKQAAQMTDRITIRNIVVNGRLECVSVLERLSEKHYVIVFRIRNYNSTLNDVGSAMQWVDCVGAVDEAKGTAFLNIGTAHTEGLSKSKESLVPFAHTRVFAVKSSKTDSQTLSRFFK